jgi:SAM-dependent methyltransferase
MQNFQNLQKQAQLLRNMPDYYQSHCQEYFETTFRIDPTSFLAPLRAELKSGDSILDVGCGSGRDLVWFQKQNFKVTGFERSAGLVELARIQTACEIIKGDFETYDFSQHSFDALMLCGSLVHIAPDRLVIVLGNIIKCLRTKGIVFISLKEGRAPYSKADGRIYYLWSDQDLREMFNKINLTVRRFNRGVSKVNDHDIWLSYVLQKA